MAGDNWPRLGDYVVARRRQLGFRDRKALSEATGVTDRTLGKLELGHRVSASTLGSIENALQWAPGSCRRILAGGDPQPVKDGTSEPQRPRYQDPTLDYIAGTPGLPDELVQGMIAMARSYRERVGATDQAKSG